MLSVKQAVTAIRSKPSRLLLQASIGEKEESFLVDIFRTEDGGLNIVPWAKWDKKALHFSREEAVAFLLDMEEVRGLTFLSQHTGRD